MILYIENYKETTKIPFKNKQIQWGYGIWDQDNKLIVLYTSNGQSKNEIKPAFPFSITSKVSFKKFKNY